MGKRTLHPLERSPDFCIDCNVPVRFKQSLEWVGFKCWDAPQATPDATIAMMALKRRTPIITGNVADFLCLFGTQQWHPGIITFSDVRPPRFTQLHQLTAFNTFAEWARRQKGFDYSNKLVIINRARAVVAFHFDVKAIHHLGPKTRKAPLSKQLKDWRRRIRWELEGQRARAG
jgi:hypothetical protein